MRISNAVAVLKDCVEVACLCKSPLPGARFLWQHVAARTGGSKNSDSTRALRLSKNVFVHLRSNVGDLQSFREVWIEKHYRLPEFVHGRDCYIDLGGNIGLSSLFFLNNLKFQNGIVVEPDASNLTILQKNLQPFPNCQIVPAAVGPTDGMIHFHTGTTSNNGMIADEGTPTAMVSMESLFQKLDGKQVDLVKMDIEGGEEYLTSANCEWMEKVNFVVTELHPEIIDVRKVIAAFGSRGLEYWPGNAGCGRSKYPNFMDMFVRVSEV